MANDYKTLVDDIIKLSPKLIYTEKQKYAKDKKEIKLLVDYFETIGQRVVARKENYYKKLNNLADGVIDVDDYINSSEIDQLQSLDSTIQYDIETVDLENFPIITNIVNRLTGDISKKYTSFFIKAENTEAVNEVLERRNEEIRAILLENARKLFEENNPIDPSVQQAPPEEQQKYMEQRQQMFQQIPAVQRSYKTDFRLEIEEWADHVMRWEDLKFNMKELERKTFRERLVTNEPLVHIRLIADRYYPELIDPQYSFELQSPNVDDASDAMMRGWFEFSNFGTILNKYGGLLTPEDIKKLEDWQVNMATNLILPHQGADFNPYMESMNNYIVAQNLIAQTESPAGDNTFDGFSRLVRETNVYFLLPKKVGFLTAVVNGETTLTEVDETFKVTIPPVYKYEGSKEVEDLIAGEHIEWTYINELWYCLKLDMTWGGNGTIFNKHEGKEDSIYLFLDRFPIQFKDKEKRYGIKIPIHGGKSNQPSPTEKAAPWQKFYNYIWNRNKQLLSTEIGKFIIMSQNMLPDESMGESWGKGNLIKAYMVAKDLSIMPQDTSILNTIQNQAVSGNFAQQVDLSKTSDVIEKANLARMIKQECYETLGINYQALGEVNPYMSPTLAANNMQQTITQLQYLYDGHFEMWKYIRETLLEVAQYLTSIGEMKELTSITSDGAREIFKLNLDQTLLYDLVLYPTNDVQQYVNFEMIKQLALSDNNLNSTAYEKALIAFSNSPSEILRRLKTEQDKFEQERQEQMKHEQEMQQQQLQAQQAQLQARLDWEANQNNMDRKVDILEAQIKAMGFANDDAANIRDGIIGLQTESAKQKQYYAELDLKLQENELQNKILADKRRDQKEAMSMQERMKLEELKLRDKEITAANLRTKAMLEAKRKESKV